MQVEKFYAFFALLQNQISFDRLVCYLRFKWIIKSIGLIVCWVGSNYISELLIVSFEITLYSDGGKDRWIHEFCLLKGVWQE